MPVELWSYIVDPGDGTIKMAHVFYGFTLAEAKKYHDEHLSHCKYMQGAESGEGKGELLEETIKVEELPSPEDFEDATDDEDEPEETDEDAEPEEIDEDDESQ